MSGPEYKSVHSMTQHISTHVFVSRWTLYRQSKLIFKKREREKIAEVEQLERPSPHEAVPACTSSPFSKTGAVARSTP